MADMEQHDNHADHTDHECDICQAMQDGTFNMEALREWERKCLQEKGFFMHAVGNDTDSPMGTNIHTHGLEETAQHTDLQIVFPIPPNLAATILTTAVEKIQAGQRFTDGDIARGLIGNDLPVKFVAATESDRNVLRIILPDKYGNLDKCTIEQPFDAQYDMLGID